jgi:hypothetical protein
LTIWDCPAQHSWTGVVESVKADIDANFADQTMSKVIKSAINPNLIGAV